MMLMSSHSERKASFPGLSVLMSPTALSPTSPIQRDLNSPRGSIFAPLSLTDPPSWVTLALCNVEQGEKELQSLRERQTSEVEEMNRELDNAIIEAQRQERRLLEKVEQDHREAQRRLEQVKRENAAAVRVGQSLVDRQLHKLGQLKEQVQRWGGSSGGPNKNQLQRGVAEVTQPWEISLSLKRVTFQPGTQLKDVRLGEVQVQDQNLNYPIGVCGETGKKCALHSGERKFGDRGSFEVRKDLSSTSNSGSMRVVRKLRLSTTDKDEPKSPVSKPPLSPRHRGASESSMDEELDTHGQDLFLAIPPISSQGESEVDEPGCGQTGIKKSSIVKCQRKQRTLVLIPSEEPSCPPEGGRSEHSDQPQTSPKTSRGEPHPRYSLLDLSSRCARSRRSLSPSKSPRGTSTNGGSPPSPAGSDDCYNYITSPSPSNNVSLNQEHRRAMSMADLSRKTRPLINGGKGAHLGFKRDNHSCLSSASSTLEQGNGSESGGRSPTSSDERESRYQGRSVGSNCVSRSLSMSAIDAESHPTAKEKQSDNRRRDKPEPILRDLEEEAGSSAFESANLIKQFGKQGSGRSDFNLPSGLHATVKGQLFVVDCGNARIQVTDLQKYVVQQVSPTGTERSARICNYFDVAVNNKGLIALTCAAERAVLVFSRHGRLLQTFGGNMIGSTHEELDAPRGVTVTRLDEFLVADIKRGTLTALMLDPKTGARLERTIITGFHRPYLVAACLTSGLMAVSERGNETGCAPCIRVLEPGWNTIRVLGLCSGMGPVLACPWGLSIDSDGDVLVADWGRLHRVLLYPAKGLGWPLVTQGLSSPRGLALLPEGQLVVSDSMNHCIKIYQYK
ncbi:uncharacterized protein LOC115129777 [Oncorhynchus nerka]|uniref:uncharacterized protein LOC115129777 n=1 Tax=Oncorhynchus nerka TaxID=8023 RepID=UPI001130E0AD|nr:uncharacterized protein LOC115129777 [Oncorhynchus nerka]